MFARLYSPAATQVNIIFIATFALIVGYSWQNTTNPALSSIGSGFAVAWRRFAGVVIGVVAAAIGSSIIPPILTRVCFPHLLTLVEVADRSLPVENDGTKAICLESRPTRQSTLSSVVICEYARRTYSTLPRTRQEP